MSGFQKKTIRKILRNRIDQLIATVDDETVQTAMKRDTLITGGCITSMLLGEKINDFDVYFRTMETARLVAEYYVKRFNDNRTIPVGGVKYTPEVRLETRPNIKGEKENRIIIFMKSAGVAGEEQTDYHYFEHGPEDNHEEFLDTAMDIAEPSIEAVQELHQEIKEAKKKYKPVFLTDNAISLSDKMQLIIRFYGEPDEIHRNFDFIHCTGVYDYRANSVSYSPEMMESLLTKRLLYSGSLYPIASLLRIRKFINRGWSISAGQMLKIVSQLNRVDLGDINILKEQLMGVDVAYMHELISELSKVETHTRVDETYLANLLDKIFED